MTNDIRASLITKGLISDRPAIFATGASPIRSLSADELAQRGYHDAAAAKRARIDPHGIGWNGTYRR